MSKKKLLIIVTVVLIAIISIYIFSSGKKSNSELLVEVKKGDFVISVTSTGELQAKTSEDIKGPSGLNKAGIWNVKISDLIPEGSRIKQGDYVGSIDRSEVSGKLKDVESELEKSNSAYIKTQLDTTLELRNARDELINLKYAYEEKKLVLDQSKYEPPATVRQAEIDLDKADRAYKQAVKNYTIKQDQSKAKMKEVSAALDQQTRKRDDLAELVKGFDIIAPKDGMLIYKRDWSGQKIAVGSSISVWDLSVATLPDLSSMVSVTYINEIDISKIKTDQTVEIGVDALPEKKYTGKIMQVANVGEQLKNSEAKVFEVRILVNEKDTTLMPSMTTSNKILTAKIPNKLFIPLECLHMENKKAYVYVKDGYSTYRQEVVTGKSNENEIVIEKGLKEGDKLMLSIPDNADKLTVKAL